MQNPETDEKPSIQLYPKRHTLSGRATEGQTAMQSLYGLSILSALSKRSQVFGGVKNLNRSAKRAKRRAAKLARRQNRP